MKSCPATMVPLPCRPPHSIYVRRDVYDADRRHDVGTAEEAMRMAQDVAGRLNCPVRPAE